MDGGDEMYMALGTSEGATAFSADTIDYKYEIFTKTNSAIDGRKCGSYIEKIAECDNIPGHSGSKWCEIDSSNGYCVSDCNQCEFSVVIEETPQGVEENDVTSIAQAGYTAGFTAGFTAGRSSIGTFTVEFHDEKSGNGLCRTNGIQCRKIVEGGIHHAYCAATNQCVSGCEQCPGFNFKDSHFDECIDVQTEYGQQ
jgi:hypothetical protein